MKEKKRVLLIDDEEIIVDILRRRFERLGFAVLTAYDGSSAIDLIQQEKIDLVVCDVKMPNGTDGEDVLKAKQKYNPSSHFVAISGHVMTDESVQLLMNNGASLFVKKPFPSLADVTQQMAMLVTPQN